MATGFTSGSYDRRAQEYVVRDLDAHSWVEAWFPSLRLGHVRPDAVGRAAALAERRPRGGPARRRAADLGGGGALDPRAGTAATDGPPWALYVGGGGARRAAAGRVARSRSCIAAATPGPLLELERALRRTRRMPNPGATLQALEASFDRSPDAAGYVRALREQRYSGRGDAPTSAQRSGLRQRAGARGRAARAAARVVGAAAETSPTGPLNSIGMADVYDLFQRGTALLEAGDFAAATVPLAKARDLDPDKTSIREALGRAYFRSSQFEAARAEFEAVVERAPTNDYALFCLGRSLLELGRPKDARKALALAAGLRPDRRDYRIYRDRARAAA